MVKRAAAGIFLGLALVGWGALSLRGMASAASAGPPQRIVSLAPSLTEILFALGLGVLWLVARELNLLSLGEKTAQQLGVEVERLKRVVLLAASLLTGAAVSLAGLIAFVGLIVPHVVRLIFGPDHRLLLPVAPLLGAIFLMAADTLARTLIAPTELPVGVITALGGGPFFIWLLRRQGWRTYFG